MLMTTPDTAIKRAAAAIAADAAHKAKPPTDADERKAKAALEAVGYRELCNALAEMIAIHAGPVSHPNGAPHSPVRMAQDRSNAAIYYAAGIMNWTRGIGPKPAEPDFLKYGEPK